MQRSPVAGTAAGREARHADVIGELGHRLVERRRSGGGAGRAAGLIDHGGGLHRFLQDVALRRLGRAAVERVVQVAVAEDAFVDGQQLRFITLPALDVFGDDDLVRIDRLAGFLIDVIVLLDVEHLADAFRSRFQGAVGHSGDFAADFGAVVVRDRGGRAHQDGAAEDDPTGQLQDARLGPEASVDAAVGEVTEVA